MSTPTQSPTETYIRDLFLPPDATLDAALDAARDAGLRTIQVSAELGRLLSILVRASGARRVLEIGALGGYSAIHLARALPADGQLLTIELDPRHAVVARENLMRAGLAARAEVRVGAALDVLPTLVGSPPFDMAFIDADKGGYPAYLDWCLRLVRPGGLIVADNVLMHIGDTGARGGDEASAIDAMNRAAAADPRLEAMILPMRSGRDGILIATVRAASAE